MKKTSKKSNIIPAELKKYAKTLRTSKGKFSGDDIMAVQKGLDMVESGFKGETWWEFDETWFDPETGILTAITLTYTDVDNDHRYHEYQTFDLTSISPKELLRKALDCKLSDTPGYYYSEIYSSLEI